jgi:hypothetical protein
LARRGQARAERSLDQDKPAQRRTGRSSLWLTPQSKGQSCGSYAGHSVEIELDAESFEGPLKGFSEKGTELYVCKRDHQALLWRKIKRKQYLAS